jgi:transposase InsO family protein
MEILEANGFAATSLVRVLGTSRNAYYHHKRNSMAKVKNDETILNEIGSIIIDFPRYGYRRIARELKIRKFKVNRKRVLRLMRENNLLVKTKKKFHATTDSNHGLAIYPNLLKEMKEKGTEITAINQVWVSDITYIPLTTGRFVFLAIVLDLYSRKVVGWNLGTNLSTDLVVSALQMAIQR